MLANNARLSCFKPRAIMRDPGPRDRTPTSAFPVFFFSYEEIVLSLFGKLTL